MYGLRGNAYLRKKKRNGYDHELGDFSHEDSEKFSLHQITATCIENQHTLRFRLNLGMRVSLSLSRKSVYAV